MKVSPNLFRSDSLKPPYLNSNKELGGSTWKQLHGLALAGRINCHYPDLRKRTTVAIIAFKAIGEFIYN